jgi:isoaspartyl peptidase/L-asparaginase-like protein (Ntn-hydrolase superfamily)
VSESSYSRLSKQDDPLTNAGRGSNLTESGHVECGASIMDGSTGCFGALGAIQGACINLGIRTTGSFIN